MTTCTRPGILAEYYERVKRDGDGLALEWLMDEQDAFTGGWSAPDTITGHRYDTTWTGASYGVFRVERY